MKLNSLRILFPLLFFCQTSTGQNSYHNKINTSGAEMYFLIAAAIKADSGNGKIPWQSLFQTPPYQMMIAGNAIDTNILKSEMHRVYSTSSTQTSTSLSPGEKYHKEYKHYQQQLEKYIDILHTGNIVDSVKALLYPYLPSRLQSEQMFPTLFYLNYGSPEATGFGEVVINDLLHSYRIDSYKFGLLAAHEAFHAIVSAAFQQNLKKNIDYNAPDFNLLYFFQTISEEGIADLIDKPILLQKNSPLFDEVSKLTFYDEVLSIKYIKSLDSLLKAASLSENVLQQYNSYTSLANTFGKNGGHIPGRFMGSIIKSAGLLKEHIKSVEDPVSFVLTYNEAVSRRNKKLPLFSKISIDYLKRIKLRYWQN